MTTTSTTDNPQPIKYSYDFDNKCDCSEDDKCGCSYPNNLQHDFDYHCSENQEGNCSAKSNEFDKTPMYTPASNNDSQPPLSDSKLDETQCNCSVNREKTEIMTDNVHYKKESICVCSPTECECSVTHDEKTK